MWRVAAREISAVIWGSLCGPAGLVVLLGVRAEHAGAGPEPFGQWFGCQVGGLLSRSSALPISRSACRSVREMLAQGFLPIRYARTS